MKSTEMNVSDLELFKKSKIIEIGSVKKKLQRREVGGFWKKSGNPEIFVPVFQHSGPKLSLQSELTKKTVKLQKVFYIKLF